MKKAVFFLVLFTAVVFTAVAAGPALTVVNNTGSTISFLYISRSSSDWEEDILSGIVIENGEAVEVTLPGFGAWHLKAIDEDGDSYLKFYIGVTTMATQVVIGLADRE
jgi:hypothetical protein